MYIYLEEAKKIWLKNSDIIIKVTLLDKEYNKEKKTYSVKRALLKLHFLSNKYDKNILQ